MDSTARTLHVGATVGGQPESSPEPINKKAARREEAIGRFDSKCYLCGTELEAAEVVIDHIIPRSRGGTNATYNLAAACAPCDHRKGDYLLSELEWVSPEVKARFASLRRERARHGNRLLSLFKRAQLAVIALTMTPERKLDSLIEVAKKK